MCCTPPPSSGWACSSPTAPPGSPSGSTAARSGRRSSASRPSGAEWFQGRPSASDAAGDTSGGSNLGPDNPDLAAAVAQREKDLRAANPDAPQPIPADALTASASGLDPDISPAYARWQAPRVAAARGLEQTRVLQLVDQHVRRAPLGFLGQDRVNVLELNVALAALGNG